MPKSNLILALGKLLIAAAWSDQSISNEEINSLKDLLFQLPEITGREWASLEMYIHSPVGADERDRLLQQFLNQLRSPADKKLAIQALDHISELDPSIGEEKRTVIEAIKAEIETEQVGLSGLFGQAIAASIRRRQNALFDAPNREEHFEDFIKNRVYYSVQRMLNAGETALDIPDERLRLLSLAGGLMARVAHVDEGVTQAEAEAMIAALSSQLGIAHEEAAFIVDVAASEISAKMDHYRLTREYFESTSEKERLHFMDVLFTIADADGGVSHHEIEEIRAIARGLRLTHKQFITAKLKIPRSRRAN
ncbi:MAG: TerB family tellurite resistance protein [Anaerolineales bacterium]|nr:TerB family tellurite resistance protein [Anaerolineales bacterium]